MNGKIIQWCLAFWLKIKTSAILENQDSEEMCNCLWFLSLLSCELRDVGVRDYKRGNPEDKDGQNKLILAYVTPDNEMKSPFFFSFLE